MKKGKPCKQKTRKRRRPAVQPQQMQLLQSRDDALSVALNTSEDKCARFSSDSLSEFCPSAPSSVATIEPSVKRRRSKRFEPDNDDAPSCHRQCGVECPQRCIICGRHGVTGPSWDRCDACKTRVIVRPRDEHAGDEKGASDSVTFESLFVQDANDDDSDPSDVDLLE